MSNVIDLKTAVEHIRRVRSKATTPMRRLELDAAVIDKILAELQEMYVVKRNRHPVKLMGVALVEQSAPKIAPKDCMSDAQDEQEKLEIWDTSRYIKD